MNELCFRQFHRAWIAYSKYCRHQVQDKGLFLTCGIFGAFSLTKNLARLAAGDSRVCYIPTPEILSSHNFNYETRLPTNFEPCSADSLVKRGELDSEKVHKVNYGAIARAADMNDSQLVYILKQIMMAIESAIRKEYHVKLNLRIGFLKFRHGQVCFENMATAAEIDQLSKSSCNTQYR